MGHFGLCLYRIWIKEEKSGCKITNLTWQNFNPFTYEWVVFLSQTGKMGGSVVKQFESCPKALV